jgi:ankyrin repeat protein
LDDNWDSKKYSHLKKILKQNLIKKEYSNLKDFVGKTPLHKACLKSESIETIKHFIENKCEI